MSKKIKKKKIKADEGVENKKKEREMSSRTKSIKERSKIANEIRETTKRKKDYRFLDAEEKSLIKKIKQHLPDKHYRREQLQHPKIQSGIIPNGKTGFGSNIYTANRCIKIAKSTGEQCKRIANLGSKFCVVHGAGSPKRRAFKMLKKLQNGELSVSANKKYLKEEILSKINDFKNDKDLNNLDFELAYLKTLPSRIENNKDLEEVDKIMLLEKALKSIFDNMDKKEKIIESRRYSIGVEKLQVLIKYMFGAVQKHVQDPQILSKIASELRELSDKTDNSKIKLLDTNS